MTLRPQLVTEERHCSDRLACRVGIECRVDGSGGQVRMAEHFLHHSNVPAVGIEAGSESMPQLVSRGIHAGPTEESVEVLRECPRRPRPAPRSDEHPPDSGHGQCDQGRHDFRVKRDEPFVPALALHHPQDALALEDVLTAHPGNLLASEAHVGREEYPATSLRVSDLEGGPQFARVCRPGERPPHLRPDDLEGRIMRRQILALGPHVEAVQVGEPGLASLGADVPAVDELVDILSGGFEK